MTTRVLIVDDHPVFRDGLAALLASVDDVEVVGMAGEGGQAVHWAAQGGIDVVLMDLNLPDISGVEATSRIAGRPDAPAVLAITMVDDDDTVIAAMQAGARGYVLKGASGAEIVAALHTVANGGAVFGRGVAAQVLALTGGRPGSDHHNRPGLDGNLTERERQVLTLLAEGANNAQIARSLDLQLKTVQNYVSRILDKLQVADRTQAALKARDARRTPNL
jgi:DNA-binding NarL/FixJ family response regulator